MSFSNPFGKEMTVHILKKVTIGRITATLMADWLVGKVCIMKIKLAHLPNWKSSTPTYSFSFLHMRAFALVQHGNNLDLS